MSDSRFIEFPVANGRKKLVNINHIFSIEDRITDVTVTLSSIDAGGENKSFTALLTYSFVKDQIEKLSKG